MIESMEKQRWLAIEGTDAVGKTQLTHELFSWLKNEYPEVNPTLLDEFSSSPVGRLIREVVNDKTFFMLGNNRHIPMAETLILGSDLVFQREKLAQTTLHGQKGIIVSDRGIYSFFVYQGIRLKNGYGDEIDWNKWMEGFFSPIGMPDLTLCLTSPIEQVERRLRARGDRVSGESMAFIEQAQNEFSRLGGKGSSKSFVILENIDSQFCDTLSQAQKVVREILIPSVV